MLGAIEAGGTKVVCGVGTGPHDLSLIHIPTASPETTLAEVIAFFRQHEPLAAIGIGSFGPIDRRPDSPRFGYITSTPKPAWRDYNIVGAIQSALHAPVGFDTDVNAAVLAEARWGAGRGLTDLVYLTVGTGIGGGAIVNRQVLHGAAHAEMGHLRIPHDWARDRFPGCCPYHGDCLEGLASGPAIQGRWGTPGESLPAGHPAWRLEAHYLALALVNLACTLAPQRILLGGGVMEHTDLFDLMRLELGELLKRYIDSPEIAPPLLGARAGVLGALLLAEQALSSRLTQ